MVSRLTDRNPRDRQNATVWRHSSKLNPSAKRIFDCTCLFVSVRGIGGGDDKGILHELLSVPEPPFDENKKKNNSRATVNLKYACLVHSRLQTLIYILSGSCLQMPLEESLWFASLDRFLMIDWFDFL